MAGVIIGRFKHFVCYISEYPAFGGGGDMRTKTIQIAALVMALAASGCATLPSTYSVDNSRTYDDQTYDQVWEKIVSFFASRNIQIKNIAKESGVIYAESISFGDELADCGTGGLMVPFARRASFNVSVTRSTPHPKVSVNTEFQEMRRFDASTTTVNCNSKGVIERAVLDAVE